MPGDFDQVKERIDLVQLIGERVALRRTGRSYVGLCPFHAEKTPSFHVDPERRTYKCFGCLPPGSLIKTEAGPRPIEQIKAGESVYAGDGRLHNVLMLHEHAFSGNLVKLVCAPFKIPILLTPDHKVPVLRPKSKRPAQVAAGEIRPQNYLLYPAVERTGAPIDWTPLSEWFRNRGKRPKALPSRVEMFEFAEWLGWYLAEGSVSSDRIVCFTLGGDESFVADRLRTLTFELFGETLRRKDRPERDTIDLWFCHALLARWLKHQCGAGARNKRLPSFVWSWIPEQQWLLFQALLLGDGHLQPGATLPMNGRPAKGTWKLTLATPTLIDDVRDLLIRNGVVPSMRHYVEASGQQSWSLTVPEDIEGRWAEAPRPVGPIPVRVRKVEQIGYTGPVYNLTVDQEHTYLTLSGTVCNCGEGGDAFTWLEKQDGLDAGEALRVLAERAGVELARRKPEEREHEKKLLAIHETAHFYFRQALRGTPQGQAAAAYLTGRGIKPETVEKFGLGYAPAFADGLLGYLRKKGFTDAEAVASGLVIDHERGVFDRFRDRLMVPIRDGKGRIIAFAGRAMRPDQPAKYMNSPRTDLFDKSTTLYALDAAKAQVRRKSEAVIVEGQFDAIACHQEGFDTVVASMGTALTEGQYRILDDLKIEKAVVAFDGDAAGTANAEKRGRELAGIVQRYGARAGRRGSVATRTGLGVYVAVLPAGMDPDELARSDAPRLRATLEAAEPVLAFVIEQIRKRSDLVSPDGRRRFLAETLPLLADESDPLTQGVYLGTLSRHAGVPEETLRQELAALPPQERRPRPPAPLPSGGNGAPEPGPAEPEGRRPERSSATERYLVAQLLQFPEEAARLDLDPEELVDPDHRAIFELLRSGERPGPRYPARLAAVVAALGASSPQPVDEDHAARAIEMLALRLRTENVRRRMGEVQAALLRGGGDVGELMDRLTTARDELAWLMRMQERDTVLRTAQNEDE